MPNPIPVAVFDAENAVLAAVVIGIVGLFILSLVAIRNSKL
jgi:hypothetical protein